MPPKVTSQPTKKNVTPPVYGKPEEPPSRWVKIMPWAFVICAVAAIAAMIFFNKPEKPLNCSNNVSGQGSLSAFGGCTTD